MSLSQREQQTLAFIGQGLAGSDPKLASLLDTFTRLTSGEEMPVREQILMGRWSARRLRRRRRHPRPDRAYAVAGGVRHRLDWQRAMLLLWLVVALALIGVAVSLSRSTGAGPCGNSRTVTCAAQALRGSGHGSRVP